VLYCIEEHTEAMFDMASVINELQSLKPDCGWLLLIDGYHKLSDHDFSTAANLLERGIFFAFA